MLRRTLCLAMLVGAGRLAWAQDTEPMARPEYLAKAAYLYNFFKFVDWPKDAVPGDDTTFFLGIVGPDPFGAYLKPLSERKAKGKKIVVQRFKTMEDYLPCHLLFVSATATKQEAADDRLAAALAKTKNKPVMLVGDREGWAKMGAVINVFMEKNLPVLEVNIDAEKRCGVRIDPQLLDLARIVRDAKEKP